MQEHLGYYDNSGYEGIYDQGSAVELCPVAEDSGFENHVRSHHRNPASGSNKPPMHNTMNFKSSKSFIAQTSDQYTKSPYQTGPSNQLEFDQSKFLQSFTSNCQLNSRPPIIQATSKAYQTTSPNSHVISVVDPECTQSQSNNNVTYFHHQPTLQEQFHRKFKSNDQQHASSRSKSHDKRNAHLYHSGNCRSQRSRHDQTAQGSFERQQENGSRVQKKHRFDISNRWEILIV